MDWKAEAIEKLTQYEAKCEDLKVIPKQIAEIDSSMTGIRSARISEVAVKGSGSGREDMLLNCIAQKDKLQRRMDYAAFLVDNVNSGLSILDPEARLVLERFFIHPEKRAADRLAGDLGVDPKTVYAMRDKALRIFTVALYGAVES